MDPRSILQGLCAVGVGDGKIAQEGPYDSQGRGALSSILLPPYSRAISSFLVVLVCGAPRALGKDFRAAAESAAMAYLDRILEVIASGMKPARLHPLGIGFLFDCMKWDSHEIRCSLELLSHLSRDQQVLRSNLTV